MLGDRLVDRGLHPLEVDDEVADNIVNDLKGASSGSAYTVEFSDVKGARYLIPGHAVGYVKIGSKTQRRVGFGL